VPDHAAVSEARAQSSKGREVVLELGYISASKRYVAVVRGKKEVKTVASDKQPQNSQFAPHVSSLSLSRGKFRTRKRNINQEKFRVPKPHIVCTPLQSPASATTVNVAPSKFPGS